MTSENNLPVEELIPIGDMLQKALQKPTSDDSRRCMVSIMHDLSIEDRDTVVCWAMVCSPSARPRGWPDSLVHARCRAYIARIREDPEAIMSLPPTLFFSP